MIYISETVVTATFVNEYDEEYEGEVIFPLDPRLKCTISFNNLL